MSVWTWPIFQNTVPPPTHLMVPKLPVTKGPAIQTARGTHRQQCRQVWPNLKLKSGQYFCQSPGGGGGDKYKKQLAMMALSMAPMPMKGMDEARATEKYDIGGEGGSWVLFAAPSTLSALSADANSDLHCGLTFRVEFCTCQSTSLSLQSAR